MVFFFNSDLDLFFADKTYANYYKLVITYSFDVHNSIQDRTPIDTGHQSNYSNSSRVMSLNLSNNLTAFLAERLPSWFSTQWSRVR